MSMRDLASAAEVSHAAIQKYESDKNMPGSEVLLRLCHSLEVSLDWFLRESRVSLAEPAFRKRSRFGIKKQQAVIERARQFLERYVMAKDLANGDVYRFRQPRAAKGKIINLDDIERIAVALRKEWNLGLDPIESLIEVLEDKGIKIVVLDINDDGFDGCSFFLNNTVPVTIISSSWTGDRQRLTISHELGHLLLQHDEYEISDEQVANRFAGAFLLPADAVKTELGQRRSSFLLEELLALKHKYGVSMSCWIRRAKDLGIISNSRYKQLMIFFRKNGWHKREPDPQVTAEKPRRFERLIYKSLVEGVISESKAAELFNTTITNLRTLIRPLGERNHLAEAGR